MSDNKSILSEDLNKLLENLRAEDSEDNSWISEMYADTDEFKEFVKKSLGTNSKKDFNIKTIGKELVEFKDEKNNPVKVPSEKYIKTLEEKIHRLEEIVRAQNSQIDFLNRKLGDLDGKVKLLNDIMGHFGDV